jgi:hypothetical protein
MRSTVVTQNLFCYTSGRPLDSIRNIVGSYLETARNNGSSFFSIAKTKFLKMRKVVLASIAVAEAGKQLEMHSFTQEMDLTTFSSRW